MFKTYIPSEEEIALYLDGLRANVDGLNLDEHIKPHFITLLDAGYIPLWSCEGHHRADNAYLQFLYMPRHMQLVTALSMRLHWYDIGSYESADDDGWYEYTTLKLMHSPTMCAYKFNPEKKRELLHTFTLTWENYGNTVKDVEAAVKLLVEVAKL